MIHPEGHTWSVYVHFGSLGLSRWKDVSSSPEGCDSEKPLKIHLTIQYIAIPIPWKLHTTSETYILKIIATTVILFI